MATTAPDHSCSPRPPRPFGFAQGKLCGAKLVAFGDSVTEGVGQSGVTEETSYPEVLRRRLTAALGEEVEVVNAGLGGDVTSLGLERMDRDVLCHEPDCVVVMFGVNDAGFFRPPEGFADTPRVDIRTYEENLREMVRRIRAAGAEPMLLAPAPMGARYGYAWLEPYRKHGLNYLVARYAHVVRAVASEMGVLLVDVYAGFEENPKKEDFLPDGLHPGVEGQAFIVELVEKVLVKRLRDRAKRKRK